MLDYIVAMGKSVSPETWLISGGLTLGILLLIGLCYKGEKREANSGPDSVFRQDI